MEIVNNVVNKLYEGLNPKDIISEQAGFWIDRFLNTEENEIVEREVR